MATLSIRLPDDLMSQLSRAGDQLDRIANDALTAAAGPVRTEMQSTLRNALSIPRTYPKRGTGELTSALGVTPVRVANTGVYNIKIGFNEPRRQQAGHRIGGKRKGGGGYYVTTNAIVANILEHGHKGSHGGQKAAPFVKPATKAAKQAAEETLKRVVEGKLQKIFGGNI